MEEEIAKMIRMYEGQRAIAQLELLQLGNIEGNINQDLRRKWLQKEVNIYDLIIEELVTLRGDSRRFRINMENTLAKKNTV